METMSIKYQPNIYRQDRIDSTDDDDTDKRCQTDNEQNIYFTRKAPVSHRRKHDSFEQWQKTASIDSPFDSANWRQERPEHTQHKMCKKPTDVLPDALFLTVVHHFPKWKGPRKC